MISSFDPAVLPGLMKAAQKTARKALIPFFAAMLCTLTFPCTRAAAFEDALAGLGAQHETEEYTAGSADTEYIEQNSTEKENTDIDNTDIDNTGTDNTNPDNAGIDDDNKDSTDMGIADTQQPAAGAEVFGPPKRSDFEKAAGTKSADSSLEASDTETATETEEPLTPAPFSMRIRFDDKYEELTPQDTADWCGTRSDGSRVWNEDRLNAYFATLKEKYDTPNGQVAFTTHDGVRKIFDSPNCGWHMNIPFTIQNLEYAVANGSEVMDPAWNSGLVYSSSSGVGTSYVEVSIREQKVFLFKNGENIFTTDCVTGTDGTTDTEKGVFQVTWKASPTTLRDVDQKGVKYEQPVEYWIAFNGTQGMHDAQWRGGFGGDIYKSWGSHGCVNLPLDAAQRIYSEVGVYCPVIVY